MKLKVGQLREGLTFQSALLYKNLAHVEMEFGKKIDEGGELIVKLAGNRVVYNPYGDSGCVRKCFEKNCKQNEQNLN